MSGNKDEGDATATPKQARARAGSGGKAVAEAASETVTSAGGMSGHPDRAAVEAADPARSKSLRQMPSLLQRLALVQGDVDYIQKEKKQGMRYSIVSHDAVTAKVRPLMVKYGVLYYPLNISMAQVGNRTQMQMTVRFVNVDDRHDFIDVETAGYGIDESDKGPGKAISYSVKYALLKCLGLESGDDPDEDQDSKHVDHGDRHEVAMKDFEAELGAAASTAVLEATLERYRPKIEAAAAVNPGRVQLARQRYTAKMRELRGLDKKDA